jgi:hypothetical protein
MHSTKCVRVLRDEPRATQDQRKESRTSRGLYHEKLTSDIRWHSPDFDVLPTAISSSLLQFDIFILNHVQLIKFLIVEKLSGESLFTGLLAATV